MRYCNHGIIPKLLDPQEQFTGRFSYTKTFPVENVVLLKIKISKSFMFGSRYAEDFLHLG